MTSVWHTYLAPHLLAAAADHPSEFGPGWTVRRAGVAMFVDIAGFTPLSEALGRLGPAGTEELTRLLNTYFDPTIACIERHGGSVLAFAGDAMTVLFPFDGDAQTVAHRALTCALRQRRDLPRYAALETSVGAFSLHVRIGVAVGEAVSTLVGSRTRMECVTGGRPIDLCAAAERLARPGEIVAHADVTALVPHVQLGETRHGFHVVERLLHDAAETAPGVDIDVSDQMVERIGALLHPVVARRIRAGRTGFVDEHRRVTTMFARFRDPDFDDPSATQALQSYLAGVFDLVDEHDGHVRQIEFGDKGSKFIAVFGAPVTRGDDQARALACALRVRDLDRDATAIGITTGLVFCGHIGSAGRHEYAVVGDAVNMAARLMQAAANGQVLVDSATVEVADRRFVFSTPIHMQVKGRSAAVAVSRLEGLRDIQAPVSTDADLAPMIGRSDELQWALTGLDQASTGAGRVLVVWGEPGIGKSRLALAVARHAQLHGMGVHWGVFDRYGPRSSYRGWRALWRSVLQIEATAQTDGLVDALRARLSTIDRDLVERLPLLDVIFGIPIPDNDLTASLEPRLRSELLWDLLLRCLQHASRREPLLLVIEDAHWTDELSLGLLQFLGRNIAVEAVCMLVLSRPPRTGDAPTTRALAVFPHVTERHLGELSDVETTMLIQARAQRALGGTTSSAFVESVKQRAAGNPLFVEELVDLVAGREPTTPASVDTVDLPDNLTSLVLARIDQLREDEQTTLKLASIIGRRIEAPWLSGSFPDACPPAHAHGRLEALCRADLLVADTGGGYGGYTFKHATIQEVAYRSLAIGHREVLHEQVGGYLEQVGRADGSDVDLLAYHYGRSRNVPKKRLYFERAGDRARAAYANTVAIDYYDRVLELRLVDDLTGVRVKLGQVHELAGDWDAAETLYRSAVAAPEASVRATALAALGDLLSFRGHGDDAVWWLEQARSEAEHMHDPRTLLSAVDRLARAHWLRCEYDVALAHASRQLELAEAAGDVSAMAAARANLGGVKWDQGDLDTALTQLRRAHDLAEESGDLRLVVHTANDLVGVHVQLGQHLDAIARLDEAATIARRIGYQHAAGVITGNEAELRLHHGDHAGALRLAWSALRSLMMLGDSRGVLEQLGRLALAFAGLSRDGDAERLYRRSIAMGRTVDRPLFLCEHLHAFARWLADRGQYDEAQQYNDEALRLAESLDDVVVLLRASLLRVRIAHESGRVTAEAAVEELRGLLDVWSGESDQAAIHYHIWRVDPRADGSRRRAAELYADLHRKAPVAEHERRYRALTGRALPTEVALPPAIAPAPQDAAEVLRQVDALQGRTATATA